MQGYVQKQIYSFIRVPKSKADFAFRIQISSLKISIYFSPESILLYSYSYLLFDAAELKSICFAYLQRSGSRFASRI